MIRFPGRARIAHVSSISFGISLALSLSACAGQVASPGTGALAPPPPPAAANAPATPAQLVAGVDVPYSKFVLPNGLTTLVHTDRKSPIVGITVYYGVGSKNEPEGHTGFAHLYEHLFFGGSANVPNYDIPLEAAGSTATNGSTSYDRTNYIETVPTGALDLALFMESDRMGHLLPAVTQDKLDKQRGVVQNEKRQGDNQPYGLYRYLLTDGLFPVGHPYRHQTIGSMADLDAATLTDVRNWFTDHYAPGNVVLVLSGDVDEATARPLVEKYFGNIPAGPKIVPVAAGPVTLPAPLSKDLADQVPMLYLTRNWSGPGLNDPDAAALDVGMDILGGLSSSRLDNELVRGKELAVGVSASAELYEKVSILSVGMQVKPGVDRAEAEAALGQVIDTFLAQGPTEDELRRAVTRSAAEEIGGLERVGGFQGKGATLAEGQLYSQDPEHFAKVLQAKAALTPEQVRDVMRKWLSRPVYALNVVPGTRTLDGADLGGWADGEKQGPAPKPDPKAAVAPVPAGPARTAPPVAPIAKLTFPQVQHFTLSNGIPVALARRADVPMADISVRFDAGYAADASDTPGTQGTMLDLLDQGIGGGPLGDMDARQFAEAQERLGAKIDAAATLDNSDVTMTALTANLAPSIELMAGMIRNPAFRAPDVARVKAQRLATLQQIEASPRALAQITLTKQLFGSGPYAQNGFGNAAAITALDPALVAAAHDKWMRPDLAQITVVGDVTEEQIRPLLEANFGQWQAPAGPKPVKLVPQTPASGPSRIVFIDRPGSKQSVIMAGRVLPITGRTADEEVVELANNVIGGDFLARLNLDLREEKGWSYGVYSQVSEPVGPRSFIVSAPVQWDKTGASIKAMMDDMKAFPAAKPVTAEEQQRVTEGTIRGLANEFETNGQVLAAIESNTLLGRPDDYYETLADRYRAIDAGQIGAAANRYLQPAGLTYVVVGDLKTVQPQLKGLGLPVEIIPAHASDDTAPPAG